MVIPQRLAAGYCVPWSRAQISSRLVSWAVCSAGTTPAWISLVLHQQVGEKSMTQNVIYNFDSLLERFHSNSPISIISEMCGQGRRLCPPPPGLWTLRGSSLCVLHPPPSRHTPVRSYFISGEVLCQGSLTRIHEGPLNLFSIALLLSPL